MSEPTLTQEQRVESGAALLDEFVPGWEGGVDEGTLNIDHMEKCVLGQLFGDFCKVYYPHMGSGKRSMPRGLRERIRGKVWELGFGLRNDEDMDDLTDEWVRVILKRRRGKK